jgi:hypothetical protein
MSKHCNISELNRWMEVALAEGNSAAIEYLQMAARTLGAQIARVAKPEDMPHQLKNTIDNIGKGVTAGMLLHHGQSGRLDVQMYSMTRSTV